MPQTYVVHLGNSKELMEVAEDNVARRVLREHIRESLGVRSEDLLFAIINSTFHCLILQFPIIFFGVCEFFMFLYCIFLS
jgi:hypothetical protein